jgi:hypothetical protein
MSESADLNAEIKKLTNETEQLMATSSLDMATAATLLERLRSCQDRAQHAGLNDSARQLRAAANHLAIRINLEVESV